MIAVDTWHGSPDEPDHSRAWDSDDVFETFKRNIKQHTQGNVRYHRTGWRDFFETWTRPVRFIHIDAQHTYEEVRDNVLAVLPLHGRRRRHLRPRRVARAGAPGRA